MNRMVDVLQTGKILLNQSDYLIEAEQIDVSFLVSPRALFGSMGNIPEGMGLLAESFPQLDTSQC